MRFSVTDEGEYGIRKIKPAMWVFFVKHTDSATYTGIHIQGYTGEQMILDNITDRTRQGLMSLWQEKKAEQDQDQMGENFFDLHKWFGLIHHKRKS